MMCARCDQPLEPGEAKEYAVHGADGPGGTVQVHKQLCPQPPTTRSYPTYYRR
ncbi:hypothetical protein [Streptomyces sp. NBC_01320]|uniref:hypothetical protein n=1 Tax=Streptomyces sp. NBC_01320 TaxID=2903824 RepID=UPI002E14CE59|nr:hypothetical protein OG395_06235 [Streptomyces sp. NBC_01320]